MRAVIGIGNPGSRYKFNRHNIGFLQLDFYAAASSISFNASKSDYYFAKGEKEHTPFYLIKPANYVNNSGVAVKQFLADKNIDVDDILVVVDDINLEFGKIRVRKTGGDGGHNGLSSIIYHIEDDNFPRIRMGIGNEFKEGEQADYVLSDFTEEQFEFLKESVFKNVNQLIDAFLTGGTKNLLDANSKLSNEEKNKNLHEENNGN